MDKLKRTSLHYAALQNDVGAVRDLLAGGAEVDAQDANGFTPLHFAAQEYSLGSAVELLEHGAKVDVPNKFGNTPLGTAVFESNGRGEMILLLRKHGADPLHLNNYGQNPIGLARLIGNYDVRQFFADIGE